MSQNFGITAQTTLTITGTSVQVCAQNSQRNYLGIFNRGSTNVYLKFNVPHVTTEGIVIQAGSFFENTGPSIHSAVYLIADTSSSVFVCEG